MIVINIGGNLMLSKLKEWSYMWFGFAMLSAVFVAITSILAKIGIQGINSNLATSIRRTVVLVMAWEIVFIKMEPIK